MLVYLVKGFLLVGDNKQESAMIRLGKSSRCAGLLDGCKLAFGDQHVGRFADLLTF